MIHRKLRFHELKSLFVVWWISKNHGVYSDKFALSVLHLNQIELATEEDKNAELEDKNAELEEIKMQLEEEAKRKDELIQFLIKKNRLDDIDKAITDMAYREKLYEELNM